MPPALVAQVLLLRLLPGLPLMQVRTALQLGLQWLLAPVSPTSSAFGPAFALMPDLTWSQGSVPLLEPVQDVPVPRNSGHGHGRVHGHVHVRVHAP